MNIVLIGFRCSGKSTLGLRIAEKLSRTFVDCDDYIEKKTHLSIREIFDIAGESYFRTLEGQAIEELSRLDGHVIATGGGAILKRQNTKYLKRNGVMILLDVTARTAYERINADPASRTRRPALTNFDPFTEIQAQMELRKPYYVEAADHVIATDGRSIDEILKETMTFLAGRGIKGHGPDDQNELAPL